MEFSQEVLDTVAELPTQPPNEVYQIAVERDLLKGDLLIYKADYVYDPLEQRKRKMCKVICTACGETIWLEQTFGGGCGYGYSPAPFGFKLPNNEAVISGNSCLCPMCGAEVEAKHVGAFGGSNTYYIDFDTVATVHNVRGHLCVLSWRIYKKADKDGCITYSASKAEGTIVVDGKAVRVSGFQRYFNSYSCFSHWETRQRYSDESGAFAKAEIMPFASELVWRSDSDKSAFEEFIAQQKEDVPIRPGMYLYLWTKKKNVENLVRSGYANYTRSVIESCLHTREDYCYGNKTFAPTRTKEYINWKKVKPNEMLGMTKEEYKQFSGLTPDGISFYKHIKSDYSVRLTTEQLQQAEKIGVGNLQEITNQKAIHGRKVPPVRLLNYLITQKEKATDKTLITPRYLLDYWNMLFKINGELTISLMWPKNLVEEHDRAVKTVKEVEDRVISEKIKAEAEKRKDLIFEDEETGLMIRPAESQGELIEEGNKLDHCVARYATEVSEGKTCILFIRHISEPDTPFFTLEYKNGKVQQNRGNHNCNRTPEVQEFENKWIMYIGNLNKKGKKKDARTDIERIHA